MNKLSVLTGEGKLDTLFMLLDKDQDGKLNSVKLADNLCKVQGDVDFEESFALSKGTANTILNSSLL